jgi:tetratricopeptide (TPR) repeat protein
MNRRWWIAIAVALALAGATVAAREVWLRYQIRRAQAAASAHLGRAGALSLEATNASGDRRQQLLGEAVEAYEQAIARGRSDPALLNDAALGLRALGKTDRAIALFQEAAALAPAWGGPDVNLADTYREIERYDDALSVFRALQTRKVDLAPVRIKNAMAQVYLDARDPRRAEEVLRPVVSHNPGYAPAHLTLALALFEQRRYAEASLELEEAMRIDPNVGSPLFLCQVYALQKRDEETLMCVRRAVRAGIPIDTIRRDPLFTFLGDRLSAALNEKQR